MKTAAVFMLFYMAIAIGSICILAVLLQQPYRPPCEMVEISPDFSTEQREYCRQLRRQQALSKYYLK